MHKDGQACEPGHSVKKCVLIHWGRRKSEEQEPFTYQGGDIDGVGTVESLGTSCAVPDMSTRSSYAAIFYEAARVTSEAFHECKLLHRQ